MSVCIEEDVTSPPSDGQSVLDQTVSKSSSHDSLENSSKIQNDETAHSSKTESSSPKVHPMAFTIDFGEGKQVDKSRLEELAKKSKARHQRIQSMSATLTRPNPLDTKPPISAKLPRKAQGYNSEGYFSSDQEDSCLSGSVKLRQSPLAQTFDRTHITCPNTHRNVKSPITEPIQYRRVSKSPIVDSIMSRSDILPSRQSLNLPLRNTNSSYLRDIHKTPSYGNLSSSYQTRNAMPDIINQSPEAIMLTDVSSPELDILTPDNGLSTPEPRSPITRKLRAQSETPNMLYKNHTPTNDVLYIDDEVDRESNNSSTGTYTIEGDNYTEEQKARMSIDRKIGLDMLTDTMKDTIKKRGMSAEKDPELVHDHNMEELKSTHRLRSPIISQETFDLPSKSKDKNVLEISCSYDSPTDNDLAAQTSKQIKSTRNYLEKIKSRVKTITEKTFAKHAAEQDLGNFTSVTTSGVLSSKHPPRLEYHNLRRCSLTKSDIDQTDYVHRLTRESSVPISLNVKPSFEEPKFESTALKTAHRALRDDSVPKDMTETEVVGKLSHLSLNRCKGDNTWIQDWADSVKEYNNNALGKEPVINNFLVDVERLPISPRWEVASKCSPRARTPTKIPSPVDMRRMTPDLIPTSQDTGAYLQKTQNAITNLQVKLNNSRTNNFATLLTNSNDKSRLPVSQLSRSNSLNYRLRRKPASEANSPSRCPGNYVIMGSDIPESTKKLLRSVSKSLDADVKRGFSPNSERVLSNSSVALSNITQHSRHKSFDGKNADYFTDNAAKTTQNNNDRIDLTRFQGDQKRHQRVLSDGIDKAKYKPCNIAFGSSIRRSSSFNTVRQNNNYIDSARLENSPEPRYKRQLARGRLDSSDLKSVQASAPRCPNTPEMQRKFGPGLVRNSCRLTNKERPMNSRMSEPPMGREERQPANHHSRRVTEPRQLNANRLTKSRSSTREFQSKGPEKGKPSQHRSSSALASKEQEFTNWKKRATYDPRKAAQEGRRKQQAKRTDGCKDDLSSPSHSSPVHRSRSYHTAAELTVDYSSEGTEEEVTLPSDSVMITSTRSDTWGGAGGGGSGGSGGGHAYRDVLSRAYVTGFTINQPASDTLKRRTDEDKRKTFIMDDLTPTRDNVDLMRHDGVDKRKTFILDSDTNSTTNGSSPRNSSIFSHPHQSLAVNTSDTEGESDYRNPKQRYSGDYSMSSSTTSISQQPGKKRDIQPRYLDISKYKNENRAKEFLRRDPSKTYVGVLNHDSSVSKGSAHHYELEQKKQELEKWKRRASYDPRKSAAMAKTKSQPKTGSNVLRSQSFHGPVLGSASLRYQPPTSEIVENYDTSSDNDF